MSTMTTSSAGLTIGSALDGQLLLPGDAGYDDARTVLNAIVTRGPTLRGGMGWVARPYRLTGDDGIAVQVVTADGGVVIASRHSHPDLYWALRGGGGNFGVVTEFEFRLHPVGTRALLAELSFPVSGAAAGQALDVLRGWRDLLSCAPRQATFTASIASDGMVAVGFVWVGDPAQ